MRRALVITAASVVACQSGSVTLLLPDETGAETAVLVLGDDVEVIDLRAPDGAVRRTLARDTEAGLAYYAERPLVLGLVVGRGVNVPGGRAIPSGTLATFETVIAQQAEWRETDDLPGVLAAVRFPRFDTEQCAATGGCSRDGAPICRDDCAEVSVASPIPPTIECPNAWSPTVTDGVVRFCTAPGASIVCDPNERATVSGVCEPVGRACDADGWPPGLGGLGAVHYVRAGATTNAGSRAAPFGRLADALAVAAPADTIALAAGLYASAQIDIEGLSLVGCGATSIVRSADAAVPALNVTARDVRVLDLALHGEDLGLRSGELALPDFLRVLVTGDVSALGAARIVESRVNGQVTSLTSLLLEDVFVVGGVACAGGTAQLTRVRSEDAAGDGLYVGDGCQAQVSALRVERAMRTGVAAIDAASGLVIEDLVILDTGDVAEPGGTGLLVTDANVTASDVFIERPLDLGVLVDGTGFLDVRGLFVRDLRDRQGAALFVLAASGTVRLTQFGIEGEGQRGVWADDKSSVFLADGYAVTDVESGAAIKAFAGARIEASRINVRGPFYLGVELDDGAFVDHLTDVTIVAPRVAGLSIAPVESVVVERFKVVGGGEFGIKARTFLNDSEELILRDVDVTCRETTVGIEALFASALTIENFVVRDCGAGLSLGTPLFGAFRRGHIVGNDVGVVVETADQILGATHDLRFEGNTRRLEFRSP